MDNNSNNSGERFVCIYHGNCADGFGAAWVVRKAFQEQKLDYTYGIDWNKATIEYIPGVYQVAPNLEKLKGARIVMVDFSYKRPIMKQVVDVARSMTWIDHHKTAIEDMKDFHKESGDAFSAYTTDKYSGAYLTWLYYFEEFPVPELIRHIDDRDRWVFALPRTREIQAAVFSYPYDFKIWDEWIDIENPEIDGLSMEKLALEGEAIERKHFKDIEELLKVTTRWVDIGKFKIPCANLPYIHASDAGNLLCKAYPSAAFAATYYQNKDGKYVCSLRSIGNFDVSTIAAQYGGGGHMNAAGFTVDYNIFL